MKVHLWPSPSEVTPDNGIGRVVLAQYRGLPDLGVELVSASEAEVIACHTQQHGLPRIDVLHTHGLYWTGEGQVYGGSLHEANRLIVEAARRSRIVTVPSEWVGMCFRRDMRLSPRVIGHGVDTADWTPMDPKGYLLWNKNRLRDVCDPTPAWEMARRGISVVSTFPPEGKEVPEKMGVTGPLPFAQMKEVIRHASIYLATTPETFGIGTLEAMLSGVPILGYAWGGTLDLVPHGVAGWLVEPGDLDGLAAGWEIVSSRREEMGQAAREIALRYDWKEVLPHYVEVYAEAAGMAKAEPQKVAVVIPTHNYAPFVGRAVESVLRQTVASDLEIVVVDDGSTDNTQDVLAPYLDRIRLLRQSNQGVAAARNNGIWATTAPYIICLDADDALDPRYVETCRKAMQADRGLGIVYTGVSVLRPEGPLAFDNGWPPEFDWELQTQVGVPPKNCIPSAAMFRRELWRRTGGYHQVYAPGEDAELWTHGLSLGFTARRIVPDGLFWYNVHADSASRTRPYHRIDAWHPWMRDRKWPMAAPAAHVPEINSYARPTISVLIPVGPGHEVYLPMALESLSGQTCRDWEVIVVNDSGGPLDLSIYPFAQEIKTWDRLGPGGARNLGLEKAHGKLCLFLDADDYLHPEALEKFLRAYAKQNGRYIYSDWFQVEDGKTQAQIVPDYDPVALLYNPQHAITVLMNIEDARKLEGFDVRLKGLEDWEFFARAATMGMWGWHLAEPLVYVRSHEKRRTLQIEWEVVAQGVRDFYAPFAKGEKPMGSCCGGGGGSMIAAKRALGFLPNENLPSDPLPERRRLEFVGEQRGALSFGGPRITPSGRVYRAGNNPFEKYVDADPKDVPWLEGTGFFKRVIIPLPKNGSTSPPEGEMFDLSLPLSTPVPVEVRVKESIPVIANEARDPIREIGSLPPRVAPRRRKKNR